MHADRPTLSPSSTTGSTIRAASKIQLPSEKNVLLHQSEPISKASHLPKSNRSCFPATSRFVTISSIRFLRRNFRPLPQRHGTASTSIMRQASLRRTSLSKHGASGLNLLPASITTKTSVTPKLPSFNSMTSLCGRSSRRNGAACRTDHVSPSQSTTRRILIPKDLLFLGCIFHQFDSLCTTFFNKLKSQLIVYKRKIKTEILCEHEHKSILPDALGTGSLLASKLLQRDQTLELACECPTYIHRRLHLE
jgi:hypothetical protein